MNKKIKKSFYCSGCGKRYVHNGTALSKHIERHLEVVNKSKMKNKYTNYRVMKTTALEEFF